MHPEDGVRHLPSDHRERDVEEIAKLAEGSKEGTVEHERIFEDKRLIIQAQKSVAEVPCVDQKPRENDQCRAIARREKSIHKPSQSSGLRKSGKLLLLAKFV
jgi:hypothetical protein